MKRIPRKQAAQRESEHLALFDAIYREHSPWMLRMAMRYVHDPTDAEDVLSEVCLRMLEKIDLLQALGEEQQTAYLATAVRNAALNSQRRQSHQRERLARLAEESSAPPENSPEEQVLLTELWDALLREIRDFPETERTIFVLKHKYRLSNAEIAERLGISQGSVRTYLSRSAKRLRSSMKHGDENGD